MTRAEAVFYAFGAIVWVAVAVGVLAGRELPAMTQVVAALGTATALAMSAYRTWGER